MSQRICYWLVDKEYSGFQLRQIQDIVGNIAVPLVSIAVYCIQMKTASIYSRIITWTCSLLQSEKVG